MINFKSTSSPLSFYFHIFAQETEYYYYYTDFLIESVDKTII